MKTMTGFAIVAGWLVQAAVSMHAAHAEEVQSRFVGPLNAKVWLHWQKSWNVELPSGDQPLYELIRGKTDEGTAFVRVKYRGAKPGLTATLSSEYLERSGTWEMTRKKSPELSAAGVARDGLSEFDFSAAKEFIDENNERFVQSLHLAVKEGARVVLDQELWPMYVRGRAAHYWNNPIDSYAAHAGAGSISVATASAAERGDWDTWGGTLVKPVLNYIERNTLSAGASIGLHRHEENQEMFFLEAGRAVMKMGVATVSSSVHKAKHPWDGANAELKETDEFEATGGWLESRELKPGQFAVIVPDPAKKNTVYMHGLDAVTPTVFWAMGTKN